MSKPFDDTARFLLTLGPEAWPKLFGIEAETVEVCNADISTIASQADVVLLLDKRLALHIENQSSYDAKMGERMLLYRLLERKALNVAVLSCVVLLRPEADGPAMSGIYREFDPDGTQALEFRFKVLKIWEQSAEKLFECGLGVLPLAFIADIPPEKLPALVQRTHERLARETGPHRNEEIWTAIDILLGLKYDADFTKNLLKGVKAMKESTTYQAILHEGEAIGEARGKIQGLREALIRSASHRFGPPDKQTIAALNAVDTSNTLNDLLDRCLIVSSWKELMK